MGVLECVRALTKLSKTYFDAREYFEIYELTFQNMKNNSENFKNKKHVKSARNGLYAGRRFQRYFCLFFASSISSQTKLYQIGTVVCLVVKEQVELLHAIKSCKLFSGGIYEKLVKEWCEIYIQHKIII